jgi:hypothetical protein
LSNHFKNYDTSSTYGLDYIFLYYQSHNVCEKEGLPGYDKLGQTRWLVDRIRENCKRIWKKMCTIDEMIIRYKGIFCPLRLYMRQKPQK